MRVFPYTNILLNALLNRPGLAAESEAVILRCQDSHTVPFPPAYLGVAGAADRAADSAKVSFFTK